MTQTNQSPKVTVDARGCLFFVLSNGQVAPINFTGLVAKEGLSRQVVRIAGGCKGLSDEFKANMIPDFVDAFRTVDAEGNTVTEFTGTAFSGGTANVKDGVLLDDMVTNVPAALAAAYPCLAISTTPRTADMALERTGGGLVVDNYGGRIDYRQHAAMVVQQNAADVLNWDGDLDVYLGLLEGWQSVGFKVGIIALNGGDVTRDEIYKALARKIPVIVVEKSGREADAFIKAFRDGDFSATAAEMRANLVKKNKSEAAADEVVAACKIAMESIDRNLVSIVPLSDVAAMRAALLSRGLIG
ncbi:MAG: hypothetical protein KGS72_25780 [Cyanobacteria bacterium REEB67]|nr:hypothetical protein [Cyanobacteria bacterium REEB67]